MRIKNAKIVEADISKIHDNCFAFKFKLEGYNWQFEYSDHNLEANCEKDSSKTFPLVFQQITRIMNVVEVMNFSELKGKYVRVEINENSSEPISKIGNIIKDKWCEVI